MFSAIKALTSALVILLAFAGCGGKNAPKQETSPDSLPTSAVASALKAVPQDAVFVLSVASPTSFWDLTVNQSIVPIEAKQATELNTAMRAHVQQHLGLDVSAVQNVLVFGTMSGGAAVIGPVKGELKGARDEAGLAMATLDADADIVAALHSDTLLVGKRDSVLASAATLDGKSPAFSGDFTNFAETQFRAAYLAAAADLGKIPLPPTPFTQGLERAGLKVDTSGIHLMVTGKPETLNMLKEQLESFVAMGLDILKHEMEASSSDFAIGAGAILAYYNAQSLAAALKPTVDGNTLRLDFDLLGGGISGTMVVAGIGVLSAVAIPAFTKYTKKSKTSEGIQFIKKMSDGARTYYATPDFASTSLTPSQTKKHFPASVGPTPPLGTCCSMGGKCIPDADTWEHPTWKALDFAMRDPHYYSYEFKTEVKDGVTSYTALAYGDLDCDGVYSTFSHYGVVVDGEVQAGADVIKQNALE
tara:strand:+ start:1948 stop:3369 length:1422 start_codon:yes stop_codon:yes gene_type:complete